VAHLQAELAASERQPAEAAGQLAARRARAAPQRAQESSIASSHRELQEAWKGMVDELKAQLKVRGGCYWQVCQACTMSMYLHLNVSLLQSSSCEFTKQGWVPRKLNGGGGGLLRAWAAMVKLLTRYWHVCCSFLFAVCAPCLC
jgi:hypothetical protein